MSKIPAPWPVVDLATLHLGADGPALFYREALRLYVVMITGLGGAGWPLHVDGRWVWLVTKGG